MIVRDLAKYREFAVMDIMLDVEIVRKMLTIIRSGAWSVEPAIIRLCTML